MSFSTKMELKQLKNNKIKIRPFQFIPNNISQIKSRIFCRPKLLPLYNKDIYFFKPQNLFYKKQRNSILV